MKNNFLTFSSKSHCLIPDIYARCRITMPLKYVFATQPYITLPGSIKSYFHNVEELFQFFFPGYAIKVAVKGRMKIAS